MYSHLKRQITSEGETLKMDKDRAPYRTMILLSSLLEPLIVLWMCAIREVKLCWHRLYMMNMCLFLLHSKLIYPWDRAEKWGIPHLSEMMNQRRGWQSSIGHAPVRCNLFRKVQIGWGSILNMKPCMSARESQQWLARHTVFRHRVNTSCY